MAEIIPIDMAKKPEEMPNRIRLLRKRKGWSVFELGSIAGCTGTHISDLETGKRRLNQHWLDQIAKALEADPRDLLWPGGPEDRGLGYLGELWSEASDAQRELITKFAEAALGYTAGPPQSRDRDNEADKPA